MAADSGMLSQEEIDAIFKKATGMEIHHKSTSPPVAGSAPASAPAASVAPQPAAAKPRAAEEAPVPVPPPVSQPEPVAPMPNVIVRNAAAVRSAASAQSSAPTVSKTAMDDTVRQFKALTDTLTKRLVEAEKRIAQLEKQNKVLSGKINTASSASVTAIVKEVKRLGGQVKTISSNLEATPGYNAHHSFVCTSCGAKGKVAVPMRCTECGQEGLKGWFRKK